MTTHMIAENARRALVVLTCLAAVTTVGCTGLAGKVTLGGKRYTSPAGNFTLTIERDFGGVPPSISDSYEEDTEFGTLQIDYEGYSDFGARDSISYQHLPQEFIERMPTWATEKLRQGHSKTFMDYIEGFDDRVVEMEPTFIPTDHHDMLFAIYRVLGGSRVFAQGIVRTIGPRLAEGKQVDALRGILIFFKGNYSYHVQREALADGADSPGNDELKRRTLALYERIEFKE